MKVLLVKNDPKTADTMKACVSTRWPDSVFLVDQKGSKAALLVESEQPNIVLMDLNLSPTDRMGVLREIRSFSGVPIIIVSAQRDEQVQIEALDCGADAYVVKPFVDAELLARINAVMRRAGSRASWTTWAIMEGPGGLVIDLAARRVLHNGREVSLTPREWKFLSFMARNASKIIPHQLLIKEVWDPHDGPSPSAIKMLVHNLRGKLGDDPRHPRLIHSHRGYGYSIALPQ